jgi:deazaflavin-dependent oxidoreductase (nitroreductase family)
VQLYRHNLGWVLGHRFLLLVHVGRRSGRRYETVVEVVKWTPDGEVVVLSGWGESADWYRNAVAQPSVEIVLGRRRFTASHRVLPTDEAAAILADYERRNRWLRPVVHWVLGRLVGWSYGGSAEERVRLASQLPMIAFRERDQSPIG